MFSCTKQEEPHSEIIEDDADKMNRRFSSGEKYDLETKTYAMEVEYSVFPLTRMVLPISETRYKVIFIYLKKCQI